LLLICLWLEEKTALLLKFWLVASVLLLIQ
jgi:hypothetical protein